MNPLQITLAVPGNTDAFLSLPQPLTLAALKDVEQALAGTLGMLRRDLGDHGSAAGEIECASWTQYLRAAAA